MRRKLIAGALAAVAFIAVGAVLFLALRDRGTVVAVPRQDLPAFTKAFDELAGRNGAPRVRLQAFDGSGESILVGRRPGLAVVTFAAWVGAAISDGRLAPLPSGDAEVPLNAFPQALLRAVHSAGGGPLLALPVAFDPWLAFWHRDFIGGAAAAPPLGWDAVAKAAAGWKRAGVSALALAGRETDALSAWLAVMSTARGPAAAADALGRFPAFGREVIAGALQQLADREATGIVQPSAWSYPWTDAIDLVLKKRAAGILLPLSRYRAINPASSAPLVIARVPVFGGVPGPGLVAELRVLVAPARGARGKDAEKVVSFLAEASVERSIADAMGMVPGRLDAPVRDGASFEGREAARAAMLLLPAPGIAGDGSNTAAFAEAAAAVLRSPSEVEAAVSKLYAGK